MKCKHGYSDDIYCPYCAEEYDAERERDEYYCPNGLMHNWQRVQDHFAKQAWDECQNCGKRK